VHACVDCCLFPPRSDHSGSALRSDRSGSALRASRLRNDPQPESMGCAQGVPLGRSASAPDRSTVLGPHPPTPTTHTSLAQPDNAHLIAHNLLTPCLHPARTLLRTPCSHPALPCPHPFRHHAPTLFNPAHTLPKSYTRRSPSRASGSVGRHNVPTRNALPPDATRARSCGLTCGFYTYIHTTYTLSGSRRTLSTSSCSACSCSPSTFGPSRT
jgi:hypothetical protein